MCSEVSLREKEERFIDPLSRFIAQGDAGLTQSVEEALMRIDTARDRHGPRCATNRFTPVLTQDPIFLNFRRCLARLTLWDGNDPSMLDGRSVGRLNRLIEDFLQALGGVEIALGVQAVDDQHDGLTVGGPAAGHTDFLGSEVAALPVGSSLEPPADFGRRSVRRPARVFARSGLDASKRDELPDALFVGFLAGAIEFEKHLLDDEIVQARIEDDERDGLPLGDSCGFKAAMAVDDDVLGCGV